MATKTPTIKTTKLEEIRLDGGTQMRAELNESVVAEYQEIYEDGGTLPPVKVVQDKDGNLWLWEGFHRVAARREAGLSDIAAEITTGTQRDAILLACGANADHGLKRSNADKRKAVETLLRDKTWAKKSDRWIADACKVDHKFVGKVRRESGGDIPTCETREGKDGESTGDIPSCETRKGRDGKARKMPEKTSAEPPPKQQITDFFKHRGNGAAEQEHGTDATADPAPEPRQYNDSFDPQSIEQQPSPASVVKDKAGRDVPERFRPAASGATLLHTLASKVARLATELGEIRGEPGIEFADPHIAPALETLQEIRDTLRGAMFFSVCPAAECRGNINAKCKKCDGRGWIPVDKSRSLSKDEQDWIENK